MPALRLDDARAPVRRRRIGVGLRRGVGCCGAVLLAAACLWLLGCDDTLLPLGAACTTNAQCQSAFCLEHATDLQPASKRLCAAPDGDADGDGLTNYAEALCGSAAFGPDSDGDGLDDAAEYGAVAGQPRDRDGDGRPDLIESDHIDSDADCLRDADDPANLTPASGPELAMAVCVLGVCRDHATAAVCEAGAVRCLLPASAGFEPNGETRCDALDNDCDGETDEDLEGKAGPGCGATGVCLGAATSRCYNGNWLCNLALLPDYEPIEGSCDGLDNDCDGGTDELPVCDDEIACTIDVCDATLGCGHWAANDVCFDGHDCTNDVCDPLAGCRWLPRVGSCDDGNPCTIHESCLGGLCKGGTSTDCEDNSSCTANPCDPKSGCLALPVSPGSACDPKQPCQQAGACEKGACVATVAKDCADGNDCTADACDAATGACSHSQATGACDDGSECTEDDACIGKACIGVPLPTCCTEAIDCVDGNGCTTDVCSDGKCSYLPPTPGALVACDDGNLCTNLSQCAGTLCVGVALTSCDDGNLCSVDVCVSGSGCGNKPLGDGASCDDGNACNGVALCKFGVCEAGSKPTCDDANPCTDDACLAPTGCKFSVTNGACDDGSLCTRQDACQGGSCKGAPLLCNDDVVCTTEHCDPVVGCVYPPGTGSCDDGNACTKADTCDGGACVGKLLVCNDGAACTVDACVGGACSFDPAPLQDHACGDDSACTGAETCVGGSCKASIVIDCEDGNVCTGSVCDKKTGRCQQSSVAGGCVTATGCASDASCKAGVCIGVAIAGCCASVNACQDQNACTLDSCEKPAGTCMHQLLVGVACNDGSACTLGDSCVQGLCRGGVPLACDDGNACTEDLCLPKAGCQPQPRPFAPCVDGDLCNGAEVCAGSACSAGVALNCNDGQACTADACAAKTGCQYSGLGGQLCDDGSECTSSDTCDSAGACKGQPVVSASCCSQDAECDDGFACTKDHCDVAKHHCVRVAWPCLDEGPCSVRACLDGACISQSRCASPWLHEARFEGKAQPAGWSLPAGPLGTFVQHLPTTPLAEGGKQALHVGLGVGVASARLPPLHLAPGAYALRMQAHVDADGGCSGGTLQAMRQASPLGAPICPSAQAQAVQLPFDVTSGSPQLLELRFTAKGVVDADRGAWIDDVYVIALPAAACSCPVAP